MQELREANLASLTQRYLTLNDGITDPATELIDEVGDADKQTEAFDKRLTKLLRHHDETDGHIAWRDTYLRDGFDYLLSYYGLVEVAAVAGLMPEPFPADFSVKALRHLRHPAVKKYYEKNYPLLLPQMLRYRLENHGLPSLPPLVGSRESAPLFALFLEISQPIDFDRNVETFLWFLDGGWRGGYDIDDVTKALGKFERFAEHMSRTGRRLSPATRGVQGLNEYLLLCRALHRLLRATQQPLLQSAFWHWHSYWLGELREQLREYLEGAVGKFARWYSGTTRVAQTAEDRDQIKAATESRTEMLAAIRDVTSRRYGKVLASAASELRSARPRYVHKESPRQPPRRRG